MARLALSGAFSAVLALGLLLALGAPLNVRAQTPTGGLTVLRSDANGILLELLVPAYTLQTRVGSLESFAELSAPGLTPFAAKPGYPQTPVRNLMLGVPQDADVVVNVVDEDAMNIELPYRLVPEPSPVSVSSLTGERPASAEFQYAPDPDAYGQAGFAPAAAAGLASLEMLRSQRIANVTFYPFRYDPVKGTVRWARRMRVEVRFVYPPDGPRRSGGYRDEGAFEAVLKSQLLNYAAASGWRQLPQRQPARSSSAPSEAASAGGQFRISVRGDSIYRLTYADLISAGVPATVTPSTLQITKNGAAVPIYVSGEADGTFDPSDYVEFYAQGIDTRYTDVNVYWLSYGGAAGARMLARAAAPGAGTTPAAYSVTEHIEENHFYVSNVPWGDGDHWFWHVLSTLPGYNYTVGPKTYTATLSGVSTLPPTATLRFVSVGSNAFGTAHYAQFFVNGTYVGYDQWSGTDVRDYTLAFTNSLLVSGTNIISAVLRNDLISQFADQTFVNYVEIGYQRQFNAVNDQLVFQPGVAGALALTVTGFTTNAIALYDISVPTQAVRLTGTQGVAGALAFGDTAASGTVYAASATARPVLSIVRDSSVSDLRSTSNGADYIVIAYEDFITATAPLQTLREGQGMRVARARISDIYDEFSDGVFDPAAIRSFLSYAYANWQPPAPQYVLLVGDGNFNYRNFAPNNLYPVPTETNYIPPYMKAGFDKINETAVDNWFVSLVGSDNTPDMAIGRLPVKTVTQTVAMVSKIISYENTPPPGTWQSTVGFFADNYYDAFGNRDTGGDFPTTSDEVAAHIPGYYTVTRAYYDPYLPSASWYYTTDVATQNAITQAINGGLLFGTYFGHANRPLWASPVLMSNGAAGSGTANLFASIANGTRQLIMLEMACQTAAFQWPGESTLAESFVMTAANGAIADWASSGNGYNGNHLGLATQFYDAVFLNNVQRVGLAINASKLANSGSPDEVDQFTLFGDPALRINLVPTTDLVLSHVAMVSDTLAAGTPFTFTLQLANAGLLTATGVVITDILPSGFVSATYTSSRVVTPTGGAPYVFAVPDLSPGARISLTIVARAGSYFFDNGVYATSVTATVSSSSFEPNTSNNTVAVSVQPLADIEITQLAPALLRSDGSNVVITYTLQFTNVGGSAAMNVALTDTLSAGLLTPTYWYYGTSMSENDPPPYSWTLPDLSPGGGGVVYIVAEVDAQYYLGNFLPITGVVRIQSTSAEEHLTNNVLTYTTLVLPSQADLVVTQIAPQAIWSVAPIAPITYTLQFTNVGGTIASGVTLTDLLPAGLLTPTYTFSGAVVTSTSVIPFAWNVSDLSYGEGGIITVVAGVDVTYFMTSSHPITSAVSIGSTSADARLGNNTMVRSTSVAGLPDLVLEHSASVSGTLAAGTPLTFTLRLTNAGVGTATGVVITEALPAGVVNMGVASSGAVITMANPSPLVFMMSDLLPGASALITVYAQTTGYLFDSGQYTLSVPATVATAGEWNSANNTAIAQVVPPIDLVISQLAAATDWRVSPRLVVTYTVQFTNTGGTVAPSVVITSAVPAGLLSPGYTSTGATLTPAGGMPYVWTTPSLAPGAGGRIVITGTVDLSAFSIGTTPITGTATLMGALGEVTLANNVTSAVANVTIPQKSYLPLVSR